MNNANHHASGSPLPAQHQYLPSSPPVLRLATSSSPGPGTKQSAFAPADLSFDKMDDNARLKSEPPLSQEEKPFQPAHKRVRSDETERPPSAQQQRVPSDEDADDEDDIETEDEEELASDPAEAIADFDWDNLMMRYHNAMQGCHDEEGKLAQEWESLMNYFRIWAASGHDHETDRTYKRLRTRATYVQNSEDRLEQTRNHYINVVKAFESALNLLKVHGFGG